MKRTEFLIEGKFSLDTFLKDGVSQESVERLEHILKLPHNSRSENLFYVGVLEIEEIVYVCLPKFYDLDALCNDDPYYLIQTLLCVSTKREVTNNIPDADFLRPNESSTFLGRLHLAKFIIDDYVDNGDLVFRENTTILDNRFQPNWSKTINQIIPIISKAGPIYDKWFSKRQSIVVDDALKRLHHFIVKECLDRYGTLLGYDKSKNLKVLSDIDLLPKNAEALVSNKLRRAYVQRDIYLLKAMKSWISKDKSHLSFLGTRHFYVIWEDICSKLFSNKKSLPVWNNIFPKPTWKFLDNNGSASGDKFEADIISELIDGHVILADAKYYDISKRKYGILGVNDIAKQINYEQLIIASDHFSRNFGSTDKLKNIFIFPARHDDAALKKICTVEIENLSSKPITGLSLDSRKAFMSYNNGTTLSSFEITSVIE